MGATPNPVVAQWLRGQRIGALALTSITVGEIRYGLALLPAGDAGLAWRWRSTGFWPKLLTAGLNLMTAMPRKPLAN